MINVMRPAMYMKALMIAVIIMISPGQESISGIHMKYPILIKRNTGTRPKGYHTPLFSVAFKQVIPAQTMYGSKHHPTGKVWSYSDTRRNRPEMEYDEIG